jgi:hypothetical protein
VNRQSRAEVTRLEPALSWRLRVSIGDAREGTGGDGCSEALAALPLALGTHASNRSLNAHPAPWLLASIGRPLDSERALDDVGSAISRRRLLSQAVTVRVSQTIAMLARPTAASRRCGGGTGIASHANPCRRVPPSACRQWLSQSGEHGRVDQFAPPRCGTRSRSMGRSACLPTGASDVYSGDPRLSSPHGAPGCSGSRCVRSEADGTVVRSPGSGSVLLYGRSGGSGRCASMRRMDGAA